MTFLDPTDNRVEALNALSTGMDFEIHGNYDYLASTERRALVFAILDVAAAIREANAKPTEIPDKP